MLMVFELFVLLLPFVPFLLVLLLDVVLDLLILQSLDGMLFIRIRVLLVYFLEFEFLLLKPFLFNSLFYSDVSAFELLPIQLAYGVLHF